MSEFVEYVRIVLESMITQLGYGGIALVIFIEAIFPPIPSDLIVPIAGLLIARGEMHVPGVLLSAVLGTVSSALVVYGLGYKAGEPLIRKLVRRYGRWLLVGEDELNRALRLFDRYGHIVIMGGHLIPGVRSLISLPAGMSHMPLPRFVIYTTLGAATRVSLQIAAGVLVGQNWQWLIAFIQRFELLVVIVMAGLAVLTVIRFIRSVRPSGPESPA